MSHKHRRNSSETLGNYPVESMPVRIYEFQLATRAVLITVRERRSKRERDALRVRERYCESEREYCESEIL